jgi:hypothetical protein
VARGAREETVSMLLRDFHARYVVVETAQTPQLYSYLQQRRGVVPLYDNAGVAAFRLPAA